MPSRLATMGVLLLAALLAACGNTAPAAQPTAAPGLAAPLTGLALPVIATYSILGDLVGQVGGDRIALTTLVGPGGDAHTYEPSPGDSAKLAQATLIFENGLAFEPWIDDLYSAAGAKATRVVVSEGVAPLAAAAEAPHAGEEQGEAAQDHAEYDPHIWHNPQNAMIMVERIRDSLVAADAANAATYEANATTLLTQLSELDSFVEQEVAKLPAPKRKLVTTHDTFGYFAARYGFVLVGTPLGASTDAADPAAGELAELVSNIRAAGVPAIFAENVANPDLMETIAREAGVTLAPTLYTDALGEAGSAGDSYITMMRYNVTTIVQALLADTAAP